MQSKDLMKEYQTRWLEIHDQIQQSSDDNAGLIAYALLVIAWAIVQVAIAITSLPETNR